MTIRTRNFFKEGKRAARKYSCEEQDILQENIQETLRLDSEEAVQALKLHGSILEREMRDQEEDLQRAAHLTELEHRQSFIHGIFLVIPSLIGFAGEALLVWWTITVFEVGSAEGLIALSIMIFGFLAFESYLNQTAEIYPERYKKYMLYGSFAALVCF